MAPAAWTLLPAALDALGVGLGVVFKDVNVCIPNWEVAEEIGDEEAADVDANDDATAEEDEGKEEDGEDDPAVLDWAAATRAQTEIVSLWTSEGNCQSV